MISEKLFFVLCVLVFLLYRYVYGLQKNDESHFFATKNYTFQYATKKPDLAAEKMAIKSSSARMASYPFEIAIMTPDFDWIQCGAALITYQWAVLPFHCGQYLQSKLDKVKFRVIGGKADLTDWSELKKGKNLELNMGVGIEKIYSHENYDPVAQKYDIALMKLTEPLPNYSENIRPACLLHISEQNSDFYKKLEVVGYGKRLLNHKDQVYLQRFIVDDSIFKEARGTIRGSDEIKVLVTQNKSACMPVDSATLVYNEGLKKFLVGLNSLASPVYQDDCVAVSSKYIFTRISEFMDWIYDTVDNPKELCVEVRSNIRGLGHKSP